MNKLTIRPGQHKPYSKATKRQIKWRIREVEKLLSRGTGKTAMHKIIKERFNVEWRQCDRYMACAGANGSHKSALTRS